MATEVEKLRLQLKETYRQRLAINLRLREMKQRAKAKGLRSLKINEIAQPKGPNTALSVVQAAMLLGVSRDTLYRLLKSNRLADLHPFTVGRLLRPSFLNDRVPLAHENEYREWKDKWGRYSWQVTEAKEKSAIDELKGEQLG